jgi:hypothetical protein
MAGFLYRCPNTGLTVQAWSESDDHEDNRVYESVTCLACGTVHLVNARTGKMINDDADD